MKIILLFVLAQCEYSIHYQEFNEHLCEASFSKVSDKPLKVEPLAEGKGLLKTFYGYAPYWVDTTSLKNLDWSLITHVAYFAIEINSDGSLGNIPNEAKFLFVINYAHPRGVRVHMTFTIFGNTNVSTFLNSVTARQNAINNIVNFVENYNIEGVNIDFEFVTSSVKDSFTSFIVNLNNALKNQTSRRRDLYIAMPAVPEWYPGYDYASLANNCDGLFIMAYDFHYSGSSTAGPVSPNVPSTFWGNYCVAKTIGSYKTRCHASKLILGVPYYGYRWPTVSGNIGASTTGTGSSVTASLAMSESRNYGRLWDNYSLTPWYRYQLSNQWYQVWYDDTASIRIKLNMVMDSSIQGAGCWALTYDSAIFSDVVREVLFVNPPQRHFVVRVNTNALNVREGPGTSYPVMSYATYGTKLVAFDYYGNWYKVYYPSSSGFYYGWAYGGDGINYRYLEGSSGDLIAKCTASLLNVREGPGTSYNIITRISYGQVFVVDSLDHGWARISIPQIGNFTSGWISLSYADTLRGVEDFNPLTGELLEVSYPGDTVSPGDTFVVRLKIRNASFAPFDSLTYLVSVSDASPFYTPEYWIDQRTAIPQGFFGLPNQTFYFEYVFRAPQSIDTSVFLDQFYVVRKGRVVLGPLNINIFLGLSECTSQKPLRVIYQGDFLRFQGVNDHSDHKVSFEVFDISGRLVFTGLLEGSGGYRVSLKKGLYFVVLKSNNIIFYRGKLLVVE
jgi:spore germination protein YaaH/SH3-like domain-containing protein